MHALHPFIFRLQLVFFSLTYPVIYFTFRKCQLQLDHTISLFSFLKIRFGCPGEGTGSETGDFSNGITAVTLVARTGQPTNGVVQPITDGEDFPNASPSISGTVPQGVQDQFKPSHDNIGKHF